MDPKIYGLFAFAQLFFRPTIRMSATAPRGQYLSSESTLPSACGAVARLAHKQLF